MSENESDDSQVLYRLSFLAVQGNVDAQIKLGVMFQWGDLPPIVVPLATRVLEPWTKGEAERSPEAMVLLFQELEAGSPMSHAA